ncbi:MAG: MraZ protein [Candidatus Berkelbacteria bacterium Licking1014_7]|uniref:Transcriptional regulator MraZ n=1 Tax=Candidatus Berkelbacteria bacterium Licking1014_7 TaxID=2017147 RepID=A0A554LJL1_9BACT|nr:MAG: MraZ protein [Candidatus Berkelbacteria bacterium Licking1014_7]
MFIGEFTHSIDQKGRIAIPYRLRRALGKGAVITRGLDNCLTIYTQPEWQRISEKLVKLPMTNPKARAFSRFMFSGAVEISFDRQGRALVPEYLRKYAGLKSQAVIAGLYSKIEIWETKAWEAIKIKTESEKEKISEQLEELGI